MDRCIRNRGAFSSSCIHGFVLATALEVASVICIAPAQAQQLCGGVTYPFPYTDVSTVAAPFCPGIMEAYVTGISKGTTPTTFSPNNDVIRLQMTTFLQRTVDQVLTRGSRRAALNQWWAPQNVNSMQTIPVGGAPINCAADGANIWATTFGEVIQVQANTGAILGTWTGATLSAAALVAAGKVFVTGFALPGSLYVIDPTQAAGPVVVASSSLGNKPISMAFDGANIWTANEGPPNGSVSIISPTPPYTVTTVTTGFNSPGGIVYDGTHMWVTDSPAGMLFQLDASGNIVKSVTVGAFPHRPGFDGANIWVPNGDNSITVVQASTGNVVATIIGDDTNLLDSPGAASFDGERILVTNVSGGTVTLFKAADLSFIANVATGSSTEPETACNDGINFWIPLEGTGNLLRF